jgi:hypothetical protein
MFVIQCFLVSIFLDCVMRANENRNQYDTLVQHLFCAGVEIKEQQVYEECFRRGVRKRISQTDTTPLPWRMS